MEKQEIYRLSKLLFGKKKRKCNFWNSSLRIFKILCNIYLIIKIDTKFSKKKKKCVNVDIKSKLKQN